MDLNFLYLINVEIVIIYSTHNSQVIGWHLLRHTKSHNIVTTCFPVADLRGGTRDAHPRGPNSFIFMQFLAEKIG